MSAEGRHTSVTLLALLLALGCGDETSSSETGTGTHEGDGSEDTRGDPGSTSSAAETTGSGDDSSDATTGGAEDSGTTGSTKDDTGDGTSGSASDDGGTTDASSTGTTGDSGSDSSSSSSSSESSGGAQGDPLEALSDEFDDPATLADWTLRHVVEQEDAQYTTLDIDTSEPDHLTLVPTTSGWYNDFDGPFLFKMVEGDFVVEVRVRGASLNDPDLPPSQEFNSAGILARDPINGPLDERWVMHDVGRQGAGDTGVGFEGKTTFLNGNGVPQSQLTPIAGPHHALLRICRFGSNFVLTRSEDDGATWALTNEYARADLPDTLQVGIVTTAWNTTQPQPAFDEEPDLRATWDYIRFWTPEGPTDCPYEGQDG